eukprot:12897191-Prorocentrum_lima.AAC.1
MRPVLWSTANARRSPRQGLPRNQESTHNNTPLSLPAYAGLRKHDLVLGAALDIKHDDLVLSDPGEV